MIRIAAIFCLISTSLSAFASTPAEMADARKRINRSALQSCQQTKSLNNLLEAKKAQENYKAKKSNMNMPTSVTPASICYAIGSIVAHSQDIGRFIVHRGHLSTDLTDEEILKMKQFIDNLNVLSMNCGVHRGYFSSEYGYTDITQIDYQKVEKNVSVITSAINCYGEKVNKLVAE